MAGETIELEYLLGPDSMAVEVANPLGGQHLPQGRVQGIVEPAVASLAGRQPLDVDDLAPVGGVTLDVVEKGFCVHLALPLPALS